MATEKPPVIAASVEGRDIVIDLTTPGYLFQMSLELTAVQARRLAADLIQCADISEA